MEELVPPRKGVRFRFEVFVDIDRGQPEKHCVVDTRKYPNEIEFVARYYKKDAAYKHATRLNAAERARIRNMIAEGVL